VQPHPTQSSQILEHICSGGGLSAWQVVFRREYSEHQPTSGSAPQAQGQSVLEEQGRVQIGSPT
jgi:hypothetical protein